MAKAHHTTPALGVGKRMSLNLVSHEMLEKVDYVGSVDGYKEDKSEVFEFHRGEAGTPVVDEDRLDENGRIDYNKMHTVLFEFPTYSYILSGDVIGKCCKMHDNWSNKH